MNAPWFARLREWLQHGADMSIAVTELRRLGVADTAILAALEEIRPKGDALNAGPLHSPPLIQRAPPGLRRLDAAFPLYTLTDFLTREECESIIAFTAAHLRPSPLTRAHYDTGFRTSTTANLYEIDHPLAREVDERICRTLGIRASYSEGIQAQRYDVGQQFKPHLDAFEPGSNVYERFAGLRGNRTWTFMVYLNEGMSGGATIFNVANHAIQPRTGMALLWYNLRDDGTPNKQTLHSGEPVAQGCKIVLTKWFRVRGDGPVMHE